MADDIPPFTANQRIDSVAMVFYEQINRGKKWSNIRDQASKQNLAALKVEGQYMRAARRAVATCDGTHPSNNEGGK